MACSAGANEEIAAYFDQCAVNGEMLDFPPNELKKLNIFIDMWDIERNSRILEPGCGAGRLTAELARSIGGDSEIYACDLSPEMLRVARDRNLPPVVIFERRSALDIPRPAAWFDLVVCLNVFPHFCEPEEVLGEFARVLKSGGVLWINHFEGSESLNHFHRNISPEVSGHMLPDPGRMRRMLYESGFDVKLFEDSPEHYIVKASRL